jgi:hypothetical protein
MDRFAFRATTLFTLLACLPMGTTPASAASSAPSPAYTAGYRDGCESGKASQSIVSGRYKKDTQRFANDKQYADGWTTGYGKCADEQIQRDAAGGP